MLGQISSFINLFRNKGRYFIQAAKIRRLMQKDFEKVFKEFDAILVPSTSRSAPKISEIRARTVEESRSDDFFTQSANMCGKSLQLNFIQLIFDI